MTSAEFLAHWRAIKPLVKSSPAEWLKMHMVVAAGEAGISQTQLSLTRDRLPECLKKWNRAKLITLSTGPKTPGRRAVIIKATPRLHALLKLTKS